MVHYMFCIVVETIAPPKIRAYDNEIAWMETYILKLYTKVLRYKLCCQDHPTSAAGNVPTGRAGLSGRPAGNRLGYPYLHPGHEMLHTCNLLGRTEKPV